jgi:hypothetical protein
MLYTRWSRYTPSPRTGNVYLLLLLLLLLLFLLLLCRVMYDVVLQEYLADPSMVDSVYVAVMDRASAQPIRCGESPPEIRMWNPD